jgi:L-serine dehydratase
MKTLRELYRIGHGPSSSHTMAPARAALQFGRQCPEATRFRVTLFGSLASTGKGHFTDQVLGDALGPRSVDIVWKPDEQHGDCPTAFLMEALDASGTVLEARDEASLGGGTLRSDGDTSDIYPAGGWRDILKFCEDTGKAPWEYALQFEPDDIWTYLDKVWTAMCDAIERGLDTQGILPGGLELPRKAGLFYRRAKTLNAFFRGESLLAAYAYAVAEENACGGRIVSAPTCGSCGVLPAVLFYLRDEMEIDRDDILQALCTAGLTGNVVKANGSLSGADVGCQGEVGTACAMAAAAAAQLLGGTPRQIEYAAEMGLEHHLGLTCDPVRGFVQIPCIERNAHAATRAVSCAGFTLLSDGIHRISFDDVVEVMLETGHALSNAYKETSSGGLAMVYEQAITRGNRS